MNLKSPLRYPGGKQRIVKQLGDKLPTHFDEYREPFLGGGSVLNCFRRAPVGQKSSRGGAIETPIGTGRLLRWSEPI